MLIVGDSQTFGHGLSDDESWPNRLQCLLAKSGDKSLIINGGIPATNADQYLARFSHYITMLHSGDRVLIVLTWNDLTVDYRSYDSTRYSLRPCPDANQSRSYSASVNCVRHPKNYYQQKVTWRRWLYEKTGFFVPAFSSIRGFLETAKFSSAAAFVALPKLKLLYYRLRKQKPLTGELSPENFTAVIRFAARIRDLAAPHGIDAAVILLPNRLFYDDQYYQAYSKAGAVFPERDYPSFATRDACRDNGLTCLSLFEALRTDKPDRYNFAFDGHLNPAGAEAVAQQVARWLIDGPLKHQP
ncbi:MAG: GDSL-type esterase/lipase family protein [Proteobacteria bacterium]|nr:GDSL-type esterase/lipase family protein [Pseudomonadota bacterium]